MKTIQRKQGSVILLALCLGAGTLQAQLTVTNNLVLWLKADALSLTNGQAVSA